MIHRVNFLVRKFENRGSISSFTLRAVELIQDLFAYYPLNINKRNAMETQETIDIGNND
jgi:hypothetical protein